MGRVRRGRNGATTARTVRPTFGAVVVVFALVFFAIQLG
jgi:hypothetical protein